MNKYYRGALILICTCLFAFITTVKVNGITAKPGLLYALQPDGGIVEIYLYGNEDSHLTYSADNYLLTADEEGYYVFADIDENGDIMPTKFRDINLSSRSDITRKALKEIKTRYNRLRSLSKSRRSLAKQKGPGLFPSRFPISGEQKSLVILVDFPNRSFSVENPQEYYTRMLNEEGFDEQRSTGSARDYFKSNSSGSFIPEFVIHGPVTLPNNYTYYGANDRWGNDSRPEQMVIDACNLLDDEIDFSEYDRNGDGFIDNVYIFYAGFGEADGGGANTIWPHSWDITSATRQPYVYDGVRLDHYACSNEIQSNTSMTDGIGTFCHEFCHVLGLPDLYSTSYSNAFTPGNWDLLDSGSYNNNSRTPPNLSSFERYALNWIVPSEIEVGIKELLPIDISNKAIIIPTADENEFYLIENRQKQGFDSFIPGHGMLVWHIDYDMRTWADNAVNNIPTHQRVDLLEADNLRNERNRGGDSFPGTANITELNCFTRPGLVSWKGEEIVWRIYDIKEMQGGLVEFKIDSIPGDDSEFDNPDNPDIKNPDDDTDEMEPGGGEDSVSDVNCVVDSESPFTIVGNQIINNNDRILYIYDFTGRLIISSNNSFLILPKGLYIISDGTVRRKYRL